MSLLKDFTVKAIGTAKINSMFINSQKWYGITIFKELILDESPYEIRYASIKYLVQILSENHCIYQRIECYKMIKQLVIENNSVSQALKLFLSLLKYTPRTRIDQNEAKSIEKVYNLKDTVIENLKKYLSSCLENSPEQTYQAQSIHLRNLNIRLKFLGNSAHCSSTGFSSENIDQLWNMFANHNKREKEIFFLWLHQGIKCKIPIVSNHLHYVFQNYFLRDDKFSNACESLCFFSSFSYFFCEVNRMDHAIELTDLKQIKYRKCARVKGQTKLLNIALYSVNEAVMEKSGKLIFSILSRFDPEILEEAEDMVKKFVDSLLTIISANKNLENVVMRALIILKVLVDKLDDDCEVNSTVYVKKIRGKEYSIIKINQNKTIRHLRKEVAKFYKQPLEYTQLIINDRKLTVCDDDMDLHSIRYSHIDVEFNDEDTIEYNPFSAISNNQEVIKLLCELLSDSHKSYTDLA